MDINIIKKIFMDGVYMLNKNVILNLILGKSEKENKITEEDDFIRDIRETIAEIEVAESIFNNVSDENLIESAILKEEAAKKKFNYLLKLAKDKKKEVIKG